MFHSDRGSQYTAFAFRQLLDTLNVVQSFSKKGYPFDNACCNVSSSISKKKKSTAKLIILYRNYTFPYLNILKDSTTLRDHMVLLQIGISLGVTMSTYCGQNLGAREYGRIFTGVRYGGILSLFIAVISAFICVVCGPFIVRCFIDHPTPEIMDYAMHYLKIISWFFVPLAWIFSYRNSLQGLDKGLVPMLTGFVELFARFLVIEALTEQLGYTAACLADPLTWIVTALPLMVTYYVWEYRMRRTINTQF